MKTSSILLPLMVSAALLPLAAPSLQGAVYSTGAHLRGEGISGPYELSAWTLPNVEGNGAGIGLDVGANRVLTPLNYTVGIGHAWYVAGQGDIIDAAFASTAPAFLNAFTNSVSDGVLLPPAPGTVLLAFWLDSNDGQEGAGYGIPGSGDRFGWVRLAYDNGGLHAVNSAIESTGAGIIAGTVTAVPEPGAAIGPLAAGVLLMTRRGRRRTAPRTV